MMIQDRGTFLKVNLDNILQNYNNIKNSLSNKEVMVVIKADAYGLGATSVGKYLYDNGVRHYGVATLEEALELRKFMNDGLILVLGVINPKNVDVAIANNISLCCPSVNWLKEVTNHIATQGELKIHVKFDSGMARIGLTNEEEVLEVKELISNNKNIELEGIFTHFANADSSDTNYDNFQKEKFTKLKAALDLEAKYIHQENTAATMRYVNEKTDLNLVRVGISLYGTYPSEAIKKVTNVRLENVSSLITEVVHVKKIAEHEKVGYGCTYESTEEEYIATLPIGYRDGILRRAQGWNVLVNGELCEIVGRVCMDQLMIRCSSNIKVGDKVLIYGQLGNDSLLVNDYANHLETIPYEVYCILGSRVPRRYYVNEKELENIF